ncbi:MULTISPECIES: hypothetical protein [Clostridium]|uniref:hypothetical protein n=1 Tax=Clostridium TaxID=1485 RepID=UPI00082557B7|nr:MULTISPECIES: hypothetical protein [Clostridium]PJI09079.1 hypothetical protein CUB90_14910 [Clostridium sp. CT7]
MNENDEKIVDGILEKDMYALNKLIDAYGSTKDKIRFAIEIILLTIVWGILIIGTFSSLDFSRVLK